VARSPELLQAEKPPLGGFLSPKSSISILSIPMGQTGHGFRIYICR
jgi:hypothetical protein